MIGEGIFEHPDFRKAMNEIGFAIVWISPMVKMSFDFTKGSSNPVLPTEK